MSNLYFAYGSNLNLEDLHQYENNYRNKNNMTNMDRYTEIIDKIGGDEYVKVVQSIQNLKSYTESEISDNTKISIKSIQKILYDLLGKNLVFGNRVVDKSGGVYVYHWTLNVDAAKTMFFCGSDSCKAVDFSVALDSIYICKKCGKGLYKTEKTFAQSVEVQNGIYFLPDYQLEFSVWSSSRDGGVLNVNPNIGHAVAGKIYEINDWTLLDTKEGFPGFYKKIDVDVISESGKIIKAVTYVINENKRDSFQCPNPKYVQIVSKGYENFKISEKYPWALDNLIKASENANPKMIDNVFFYGTLRKGESRESITNKISKDMKEIYINAKMYDVGPYPAITLENGLVVGELHTVNNAESILRLDGVEGFNGYDTESLYLRVLQNHQGTPFWTYVWNDKTDNLEEIPTGDWKNKR